MIICVEAGELTLHLIDDDDGHDHDSALKMELKNGLQVQGDQITHF